MLKLATLIAHLEEVAPLALQESYDNAGLQIGSLDKAVKGVMTTLDVTLQVLEEAVAKGCNVVLTHHPLIFAPLRKIGDSQLDQALCYAIRNDIAIYVMHTNLDVIPDGVNKALADSLGLQRLHILAPKRIADVGHDIGFGICGHLPQSYAPQDFLIYLKDRLDLQCIRHTRLTKKDIRHVAVMGGVGISCLAEALAARVDAFVTSDVKYHQFFDVEDRLLLVDIGHYESEVCVKKLLANLVSKKFSKIAVFISDTHTNPVYYHV